MKYQEITDKQWSMIKSHLPKPARTGRPRANDRLILNGILFVLVTGCRWTELPVRYGSKSTALVDFKTYNRKESGKRFYPLQLNLLIHQEN